MTFKAKPTFVFVHGAGHRPTYWSKVTVLLSKQGYKSLTPTLPSTLGNAAATLADDITTVHDAIMGEATQGRDVIVVAHSYGGFPGASAIEGLAKKNTPSEHSKDDQGHVIGVVMIATGFAVRGVSFFDGLGGKPPPFWRIDESGFAEFTLPKAEIKDLFYHDLPVEEGEYWVTQLTQQALKPLMEGGEQAYSGWKDVPCWYLATTDDRSFPIEAQKMMVGMAREQGGDVTLIEVESSHSPMLSKPEETVESLVDAAKEFACYEVQG